MSSDNYKALGDFIEFDEIERDAFGRCRFLADVIIRASGRGGAETLETRISFSSGDSDQLVIASGSILDAGKLPLGYRSDSGDWEHNEGVLNIRGKYQGFAYTTEVRLAT